jgi:hypothetical protein
MLNQESTRNALTGVIALTLVSLLSSQAAFAAVIANSPTGPLRGDETSAVAILKVPISTSGNNVYMAWPNNDTGHWNVFFAKSVDGGKTFENTVILSPPNKGHTINQNVEIAASGSDVYITWWTNKTGTLMPVFRASNDTGETFGRTIMLNSTG